MLLAVTAGYGVFLLYTAETLGWTGIGIGPRLTRRRRPVVRLPNRESVAVAVLLFVLAGALGFTLFGGVLPPAAAGAFAATFPFAAGRRRAERARAVGREAWPSLIEEIRLEVGSLGRSVPQALFEAGRRAPVELRPAFAAAERQWLVTTDFPRTVALLQALLADATADATMETLLVANEVGGTGIDRRLAALAEDRVQDLRGRKAAEAQQAGVRFARRFVLLVPLGMALAGASIGTGRDAYATRGGQTAVAVGIGMVAACWGWAGRLLRLPEERRVLVACGREEAGAA